MYHPSFISFLGYFNGNQDYFECHEELEEYWKDIAPGERKHPLTGYIQLATGLYHWRRGNNKGATTILKKGYATLQASSTSPFVAALDYSSLMLHYAQTIEAVAQQQPFEAFKIIITDVPLQQLVLANIANQIPYDAHYLMNKHTQRDRSEIILSRQQALLQRQSINAKRSRH
ncbi:DUF309 domain-containing protein [Kurthia sibirica]|uniref:DUF309 domain-containing protein n=2 Tax=Kurthia sibirica TaxID=202750 RepID=A0A2U3AR80_9BACL|nr:DUF309 domain-containing protein [Kurthia sibirica]